MYKRMKVYAYMRHKDQMLEICEVSVAVGI